jgi:putative transposase
MKIEYNNLYTHFILTTLNRYPCIKSEAREEIERYITGIINNHNSKLYAIYANPEHVHLLVSRCPKISEESLMSIVADSSSRFINSKKLCTGKFLWQEYASAFSVSKSDVDRVCKYILNQPEHHQDESFNDEYRKFMLHYQNIIEEKNR